MTTWNIDNAHSEIGFKVKHLMISTVRGHFTSFEGKITSPDDDFTKSEITFSAEMKSITTNSTMRDEHLKSPDFFNAAEFPTLSFASSKIEKKADNAFAVTGLLTMHGVAKEITLNAMLNGKTVDMYKNNVMSLEVTGSLSRKDFGLTWNAPIETGGVAVSDEVILDMTVEATEAK